jgi:hypothetical protein
VRAAPALVMNRARIGRPARQGAGGRSTLGQLAEHRQQEPLGPLADARFARIAGRNRLAACKAWQGDRRGRDYGEGLIARPG